MATAGSAGAGAASHCRRAPRTARRRRRRCGAHGTPAASKRRGAGNGFTLSFDLPLREARDAFERAYFEHHLRRENGSMTRVAEKTGLERTHLYRKLKQLGVEPGQAGRPTRRMTQITLVTGVTTPRRSGHRGGAPARHVRFAILEGLPNGQAGLAAGTGAAVAADPAHCAWLPCCTGSLTMRVTLNRVLRHAPQHLFIGLADTSHLRQFRDFLRPITPIAGY